MDVGSIMKSNYTSWAALIAIVLLIGLSACTPSPQVTPSSTQAPSITPTVKEGYILRVSEDLLDIMQWVTGSIPRVVPITTQDITPYGNGLYHLNSIMQPWVATNAAVVGVAITTEVPVPGCATGVSHVVDIELAGRFCLEVAKAFGEGKCRFYDEEEFNRITKLYGSMDHLRALGKA